MVNLGGVPADCPHPDDWPRRSRASASGAKGSSHDASRPEALRTPGDGGSDEALYALLHTAGGGV